MNIKTSELTGAALDWAVCRAGGGGKNIAVFLDGHSRLGMFAYSTDWSQGGPIIEREFINLRRMFGAGCAAFIDEGGSSKHSVKHRMSGKTALIAAMRCYVASKLGDEIDVPEELV